MVGGALIRRIVTPHNIARLPNPIDLLLPPCCVGCQGSVAQQGTVCAPCWKELEFASQPLCMGCGFQFAHDMGRLCASCLKKPPIWQNFAHALYYNEPCKRLIIKFKHGSKFAGVTLFTTLLHATSQRLPPPDLIVPVPLHPRRLFQRTFNQSAVLAQRLATQRGTPSLYAPQILQRIRFTGTQKGLNPEKRWQNVQRAFTIATDIRMDGQHVWLVDDVVTTSATITATTRVLQKAGATVSILALARVHGRFHQH